MCVWLRQNHVLHLGGAYQRKNQHHFPSFYEVAANNLRPPQPVWCVFTAYPCWIKSPAYKHPWNLLKLTPGKYHTIFQRVFSPAALNNGLLSGCKIGHNFAVFFKLLLWDLASFEQFSKVRRTPPYRNTLSTPSSSFSSSAWQHEGLWSVILLCCIPPNALNRDK